MNRYVLGLDFGSLSGRALLVDAGTGETVAESVYEYPHAVMYRSLPDGTPLPDGSAVQHPQDYLDALSITVQRVKELSGCNADESIGIAGRTCMCIAFRKSFIINRGCNVSSAERNGRSTHGVCSVNGCYELNNLCIEA